MRSDDPRPLTYKSPLESYSARSVLYARAVIAVALLLLLFIGIIEFSAFCQDLLGRGFSVGPVAFAIGTICASSAFFSVWALFRVRTFPLWKLVALLLVSMIFAAIGWIYVIASAH